MGALGTYGVFEHIGGVGVSKHTGGIQMYGGIWMPPLIRNMPASKKSRKNLFKAKFQHLRS